MFRFSITDLGVFLGKSPVTIRAWERKGMLTLPRVGTNRAMTTADVIAVAGMAHYAGRISTERFELLRETIGMLNILEQEKV